MVKNCGAGGKGHKSMTKKSFVDRDRSLLYKEAGQDYAKVLKMLGNSRCLVQLNDTGSEVIGIICGRMRKKFVHRVSVDDVVLVCLRDFQDDKTDIVHVYDNSEVRILQDQDEFSTNILSEELEDTNVLFIEQI